MTRLAALCGTLALAAAAFTGCQKEGGDQAPAPKPAKTAVAPPQQARVVGGAAPSAGEAPSMGELPAGHPAIDPNAGAMGQLPAGHPAIGGDQPAGQLPAGHPAIDPNGAQMPAAGGASIQGTIALAPALKDAVKSGEWLFLIARPDTGEGGAKGPPLAVKKLPVTGPDMFPLKYELTSADVMLQGMALQGNVRVEARIDQDGDAISKVPGDVLGSAQGPHAVGAGPIDFTLDQKL